MGLHSWKYLCFYLGKYILSVLLVMLMLMLIYFYFIRFISIFAIQTKYTDKILKKHEAMEPKKANKARV